MNLMGRNFRKQIDQLYEDKLTMAWQLLHVYVTVLVLFLVGVWLRIYLWLKRNFRYVDGFILLIPYHIIKGNQHLKIWIKKHIKGNASS